MKSRIGGSRAVQDQLQTRHFEGSTYAVIARQLGLSEIVKCVDQALLHREHGVGVDVGAPLDEDVGRELVEPGRFHDEVDVRWSVGVARGGSEEIADGSI